MSAQITHSQPLGPRTYLLDPNLSFIDIASLLDRESDLKEFTQIVESRDYSDVCTHLASTIGHLMPFQAAVNTLNSENGGIVFRDDYEYYLSHNTGIGELYQFNPFAVQPADMSDMESMIINCREVPRFKLSGSVYAAQHHMLSPGATHNPLLTAVIADYLTYALNVEQCWAKRHESPREHVMQPYISLHALISKQLPHLSGIYNAIEHDIRQAKSEFMAEVINSHKEYKHGIVSLTTYAQSMEGISDSYLEQVYEARGKKYEDAITQDLWDHPDVQDCLETLEVELARSIARLSNIEAIVAELSTSRRAIRAYDVFQCQPAGNRVIIKNLGDYRVLSWEMFND